MFKSTSIFIVAFLFCISALNGQSGDSISIHRQIVSAFDVQKFQEAANGLSQLKSVDPNRYRQFPYALLHARTLAEKGDQTAAYDIYLSLSGDPQMRQFCLLPLARIAATRNLPAQALLHYADYLRDLKNPDYKLVAQEAFDYALARNRPSDMIDLAHIVERAKGMDRLAKYYLARSYLQQKQDQQARSLLLTLISRSIRDDVTNLTLSDLDSLDGKNLNESDLARRGELAYNVWNFDLARKYLQPVATKNARLSYFYARALYFSGDLNGAKKAFQTTIDLWPRDPESRLALFQLANVSMQSGEAQRALGLFQELEGNQDVVYRMVQILRSQSRFDEAIALLQPYCTSRTKAIRSRASFVQGRIYFQTARYKAALGNFEEALKPKSSVDQREVSLWKARTLEKLDRKTDAAAIYKKLSTGSDYFAAKAVEKIGTGAVLHADSAASRNYRLCRLPDSSQENEILSQLHGGNLLPALLYLHLYQEATQLLPNVSAESWKLLGINPADRSQRFLGITQVALLGNNFAMATYYSELFFKTLPKNVSPLTLPKDVLRVLFPLPYKDPIIKFAKERNVDPLLVMAIMKQESKFKPFARSQAFARGLMQLIPQTAARIAFTLGLSNFTLEQLYLPEVNINLGTKYIQDMMKEFGEKVEILAAGYNGGELNLRRWLAASSNSELLDFVSNIDMSETKKYVMIVETNYELYKKIYGSL